MEKEIRERERERGKKGRRERGEQADIAEKERREI